MKTKVETKWLCVEMWCYKECLWFLLDIYQWLKIIISGKCKLHWLCQYVYEVLMFIYIWVITLRSQPDSNGYYKSFLPSLCAPHPLVPMWLYCTPVSIHTITFILMPQLGEWTHHLFTIHTHTHTLSTDETEHTQLAFTVCINFSNKLSDL